jgi:hypothetical protein
MPQEKFPILGTSEETLKAWQRILTYMFSNIAPDNLTKYAPGNNSIKDYMIDFGSGAGQVDASDVPFQNTSTDITGNTVNDALTNLISHTKHGKVEVEFSSGHGTLPLSGFTTTPDVFAQFTTNGFAVVTGCNAVNSTQADIYAANTDSTTLYSGTRTLTYFAIGK